MKRLLLVIVGVAVLAAAGYAALTHSRVNRPYRGYDAPEQYVDIPTGSGVNAIAQRLADAGVVRSPLLFRYAVWLTGEGRSLKAGEYRFDRPMTPREVAEKIERGDVYLRQITFPEGLTIREMAARFEQEGFGPKQSFIDAGARAELVREIDPAATDLEGYLFPDTYALPRRADAARLVELMVSRFERQVGADLPQRAQAAGMTVRQAVTLASLVEKETGKPEERPLVAAVYANRLKIGMGLQCDPTVIYAISRTGREVKNLTREDLQFDSPYNTYRYAGLPPGPIASPGRASIDAALQPANVPYLYFVSRNDGSHVFASTLAEHNRNVFQWQVLYWREQRRLQKERGGH
ncbi:MAG TPA: endolytic transglycosylase MltG [Vicinamibacterales bacterium]|nr:endolytic transglycosylase MltG [Vicinamibacterales bacterium]